MTYCCFLLIYNALRCSWLEENIFVFSFSPYLSSQKRILVECLFNNLLVVRNISTDLREIWQNYAHWASEPYQNLKFQTFKNPRWWTAAILKIENGLYSVSPELFDRSSEISHNDT